MSSGSLSLTLRHCDMEEVNIGFWKYCSSPVIRAVSRAGFIQIENVPQRPKDTFCKPTSGTTQNNHLRDINISELGNDLFGLNNKNTKHLPTTLRVPDIDIGRSVLSWQMYLPASDSWTPRMLRNQESLIKRDQGIEMRTALFAVWLFRTYCRMWRRICRFERPYPETRR